MTEPTMAVPSTTTSGTLLRRALKIGTLGLVACGACCAVPLFGLIGGGALVSFLCALTEGVTGAVLAGLAALAGGVWLWRHRQTCRVPTCTVSPGNGPQNRKR